MFPVKRKTWLVMGSALAALLVPFLWFGDAQATFDFHAKGDQPSFKTEFVVVAPKFRHCFRSHLLSALQFKFWKPKCRGPSATRIRDLFMGDYATLGAPGRAFLNAKTGVRSVAGGLVIISNQYQTAEVALTGIPHRSYTLFFPRKIRLTGTNGQRALVFLTKIHSKPSLTGRLNEHGKDVVSFGARLHVPRRTPHGRYRATVPVTVVYN